VGHAGLVAQGFRALVGFAVNGFEVREDSLARPTHGSKDTGRSTSPLGTFGTKYVDLGGMTSPASATANTCSTLVGLSNTAAAAPPWRTASNAAWGSAVEPGAGGAVPPPRVYCPPNPWEW